MPEKKQRKLIFRVLEANASVFDLYGSDRAVFIQLINALNPEENGTLVWPGQEYLSRVLGISERVVREAIRRIRDSDLIKLHRRTGRHNIYSVNVGLIHRLLETGEICRSDKAQRQDMPVRPAKSAGQTGEGCLLTAKEQPRNTQEDFLVGCSSTSKVTGDPKQRELAVLAVVAGAADRMRIDRDEQPKIEKSEDEVLPTERRGGDP